MLRKPAWLKARIGSGPEYARLSATVRVLRLHTVCDEAICPNKGECWEHGHLTLMILGDMCSRSCAFCGVGTGPTGRCDTDEPRRVAEAVGKLSLKNIVITSVTRDDLEDGGASVWAETIAGVRAACPETRVEALIPDFQGSQPDLDTVLDSGPDILGHNLETVPSLYHKARPQADYRRSLAVLRRAHESGFVAKTAVMVGLGETPNEIDALMDDALSVGCEILYIGQYLQPTRAHLPVSRYVEPAEFEDMRISAKRKGFGAVVAGPLVRSSYYSEEQAEYLGKKAESGKRRDGGRVGHGAAGG